MLLRSALAAERHGVAAFDFCVAHGVDAVDIVVRFVNAADRLLSVTAVTLLVELIAEREQLQSWGFSVLKQMLDDSDQAGEAQRGLSLLAGDPENDEAAIRSPARALLHRFPAALALARWRDS